MTNQTTELTDLLLRWRGGDPAALDDMIPLVYRELRQLARGRLSGERREHTLSATDIVHEAYLRLLGKEHPRWRDREHFFAVASLVMRRILIDHARRRNSVRRGGERTRASLEVDSLLEPRRATELIAIDELLTRLRALDPRKSRIVELRYFVGLSIEETARTLGISPMTVVREWRFVRAWMTEALNGSGPPEQPPTVEDGEAR